MIISKLIKIKKSEGISTEYIEDELRKLNIEPLRWAIVKIQDKSFTINVAYVKM